jgi:hypothetical protein
MSLLRIVSLLFPRKNRDPKDLFSCRITMFIQSFHSEKFFIPVLLIIYEGKDKNLF